MLDFPLLLQMLVAPFRPLVDEKRQCELWFDRLGTAVPLFVLAVAICGVSKDSFADTYVCADANGNKQYRDQPCGAQQTTLRSVATYQPSIQPANVPVAGLSQGKAQPGDTVFKKSPNSPTIGFYYNPGMEPVGVSINQVEAIIQESFSAWNQKCNINLVYRGIKRESPAKVQNAEDGYLVRWDNALQQVANHGLGAAGVAGSRLGILLNPSIKGADELRRVFVHEVGHVIGIGHLHDDPDSVMSYLSSRKVQFAAKPNASDYLNCNIAISQKYGINFDRPADITVSVTSDADAAKILMQRRSR